MAGSPVLQEIIGTDKRNPCLSVCRDEKNRELHVYYGAELLEVVPDDRQDMRFKLMVAHLFNAGVKVKALAAAFEADPKTMRHWGRALRSGDPKRLAEALAGREGHRKLTAEVEAFVRFRFMVIYAQDRYTYSARIREEIKEVFSREISSETLRPLFNQLKEEYRGSGEPEQEEKKREQPSATDNEAGDDAEEAGDDAEEAGGDTEESNGDKESGFPNENGGIGLANRKETPLNCQSDDQETSTHFLHHGGVLLFSSILMQSAKALGGKAGALARQWLAQILLGAVVIEQSKLLNRKELKILLGEMQGTLHVQRRLLGDVATKTNISKLFGLNAQICGLLDKEQCDLDLYLDPHTHHYTGLRQLLKAWCPGIRLADRAWHADFVHSDQGVPLFVVNNDNFYDLRERFFLLAKAFRKELELPEEAVLSWVVDRGIFGMDTFERILKEPNTVLITWEKGYLRDAWPETKVAEGRFVLERARNHAEDLKRFPIEYLSEESWSKNPRMRRVIFRITSPEGKTLEMAILTNDKKRCAGEIIRLMVKRWLQENDFKYLEKHFGIGAITGYAAVPYQELTEELEDRQMKNIIYQQLEKQVHELKKRTQNLTLSKERAQRKRQNRRQEIERLEKLSARKESLTQEESKSLSGLRGAQKRAQKYDENRQEKIDRQLSEIEALEVELKQTERQVSRLDQLIAQGAERLRGEKKYFMDALKILARNAFYQMLGPFKEAYNNYRDDHELFRELTHSSAVLELGPNAVHCHLLPSPSYPPAVRRVIQKTLDGINATKPQIPDGSGRQLTLSLALPEGIEFAFSKPANGHF